MFPLRQKVTPFGAPSRLLAGEEKKIQNRNLNKNKMEEY